MNLLEEKAKTILRNVTERVYKCLLDIIEEDIYSQPPGEEYKRTRGFYNAFKLSDLETFVDEFVMDIFYDWNSMEAPSYGDSNNGYTHGNYETYEDRRADLYWILNDSNWNDYNSDFPNRFGTGGAIGPARGYNYWDDFMIKMDSYFNNWVKEECEKQGLELESISIIT